MQSSRNDNINLILKRINLGNMPDSESQTLSDDN